MNLNQADENMETEADILEVIDSGLDEDSSKEVEPFDDFKDLLEPVTPQDALTEDDEYYTKLKESEEYKKDSDETASCETTSISENVIDIDNSSLNAIEKQPENVDETVDNTSIEVITTISKKKTNYKEGNIVLARVGRENWWPAMVTKDPICKEYKKPGNQGNQWHVIFFGDPKRAWQNEGRIMPFLTREEFKNRHKQLLNESRVRKDALDAFIVKEIKKRRWIAGMKDAERCSSMNKISEKWSILVDLNSSIIKNVIRKRKISKKGTIKPKFAKKQPSKKSHSFTECSPIKIYKLNPELAKTERQMELEKRKEEKRRKEGEKGPAWEYILVPVTPKPEVPDENKIGLFKKQPCCLKCESPSQTEGDILKCKGSCGSSYHKACLNIQDIEEEKWKCADCVSECHPCFICKTTDQEIDSKTSAKRCIFSGCGKWYHEDCLTATPLWPQTRLSGRGITCPAHTCHTCASTSQDPKEPVMKFAEKLIRCLRCPTSYHGNNCCPAAGTIQITKTDCICPKHYMPPNPKRKKTGEGHIHIDWCLECSDGGGELLECEICPSAFHPKCLNKTNMDDSRFYCEDCENGRKPLYEDIVWVKTGHRWWPAEVLHPSKVPDNIDNIEHQEGQFPVMFMGDHLYKWENHGRCFLYTEGDDERIPSKKQLKDKKLREALDEAEKLLKKYKNDRIEKELANKEKVRKSGSFKPKDYIYLRKNKPYGDCPVFNGPPPVCDCKSGDKDPCGENSDCSNRLSEEECSPKLCPAGDRCGNQRFQKRQYADFEVIWTDNRGGGLRAKKSIKKDSLVIEYVGEILTMDEFERRKKRDNEMKADKFYYLTLSENRMLDAGPKGNEARFANHSCDPNTDIKKWKVQGDDRIGLIANRDIEEGDEITFGYGLEAWVEEKEKMLKCLCGTSNCSGFIGIKPVKKEIIDEDKTQGGKPKKGDKKKKGEKQKLKSTKPVVKDKFWEYVCNVCDDPGFYDLKCTYDMCPKVYHFKCTRLKTLPKGNWTCPWHKCDVCNKKVEGPDAWCRFCEKAYCQKHKEGNLMHGSELGTICRYHEEEEVEEIVDSQKNNDGKVDRLPTPKPTSKEITAYKKTMGQWKPDPEDDDKENKNGGGNKCFAKRVQNQNSRKRKKDCSVSGSKRPLL